MTRSGVGVVPARADAVWRGYPGATGTQQPLTFHRGTFLPEGASEVEHQERSGESETEPEQTKQEAGGGGQITNAAIL